MIVAMAVVAMVAVVFLAIGIPYSFAISLSCFVSSVRAHLNPYAAYVDKRPDAPPGTRRNYFFGPGYRQIATIVKDAKALQRAKVESWRDNQDKHEEWFIDILAAFYDLVDFGASALGFVWLFAFSSILSAVLLAGMGVFFACFSILWIADRAYLMFRSISSRCPTCKRTSVVPAFECERCGTRHAKLTPGPYGVFSRKCACGAALHTTVFSGRSRLAASCPHCSADLAASDTRQFGIQLVGGTSAGKTAFLASFWHCYLDASKSLPSLQTQQVSQDALAELEYWFKRGLSVSTAQTNANMYSVIHRLPGKVPLQFSIYDIADEAFGKLDEDVQQQQFKYCEGVLFVLDPTAPPEVAEETLAGFLGAFKALKGKGSTRLSSIPAALVISKADLFKREIGLVKIRNEHDKNGHLYTDPQGNSSFGITRDAIFRSFLESRRFANAINLLAGEFKEMALFPASAIGHVAMDGDSYEPWGVTEPVFWIAKQSNEHDKPYFLPVESAFATKGPGF